MRFALKLALLVVVTACSDRTLLGPEHGRRPCRPSAELMALVTPQPFAPRAMRSALLHGADVMTLAITDGPHRRDLEDAMRFAAADISVDKLDSACRLIEIADDALTALPDSAASLPDRVGIRLILALTARSLAAEITE